MVLAMRVTIKTEGGTAHFPGLARPVEIDTEDLAPDEARELEEGLRTAGLLGEHPCEQRDVAAPNVPDARCHTITVERDHERRSAQVCDPVASPALGSLISLLERHRRRVIAASR